MEKRKRSSSGFWIVGDPLNKEYSEAFGPVCLLNDRFYIFAREEIFVVDDNVLGISKREG